MTLRSSVFVRPAIAAALGFGLVASTPNSNAQLTATNDWVSDTIGNWSVGANWSNTVAPTSGAGLLLRFFGTTNFSSINDISDPFVLTAMTFTNASSNSAISIGGGRLDFQDVTGVGAFISQLGAAAVNIGNQVSISATNLTLNGNGTGLLTFSNVVSGTGGLIKSGNHTAVLMGTNTYAGNTRITAGNLRGIISSDNQNVFGANMDLLLQGGTLQLRSDLTNQTVGAGSGYNLVVGQGSNATVNVDRLTIASTNNIYHFNTLSVSNGTIGMSSGSGAQIIIDGATTLGGTSNVFNVSSGTHSLNGAISESAAGVVLRKIGGGRLILNTNGVAGIGYTGATYVDAGQLQVLATTGTPAPLAGTTINLRGGSLEIRATNSLTFGPGSGYNFAVQSNNSTINADRIFGVGTGQSISYGDITFSLPATNLTISSGNTYIHRIGNVTLAGNTLLTTSNVFINGTIADGGSGFSLRKSGQGRLFITNLNAISNTYSGGTIIQQGFVEAWASSNNPAPLGSGPLTLAGGTLDIRTSNNLSYGPGGVPQNVLVTNNSGINADRFTSTGTGFTVDLGDVSFTNNANALTLGTGNAYTLRLQNINLGTNGANHTLTVNSNVIVTGVITESSASGLIKAGVGRLSVTSLVSQAYSGTTYINAGQLQVAGDLANAAAALGTGSEVRLNTGTLELRGDTNLTWGAGSGYSAIVSNGGGTISIDRSTTNGINQVFKLNNITFLTNTGTLTVNGANGYTMMLNGVLTAPQAAGPDVVINPATANSLSNNVVNLSGTGAIVLTNGFTFTGSNLFSGVRIDNTVTLDGSGSPNVFNTPGTMIFNGPVVNGGTAASVLHKLGGGTLAINSNITAGPLSVTNDAGTLQLFGPANSISSLVINGGTVLGVATTNVGNTPFGSTTDIVMNGGTLQLRSPDQTVTFGAGSGYGLVVNKNSTLNLDRFPAAGGAETLSLGNLTVNNSRLTISQANNHPFRANGSTEINGVTIFSNTTTVTLTGNLTEGSPNAMFIKQGVSNITLLGASSPTHSGGTYSIAPSGGQLIWAPSTAPAAGASVSFGTGPIYLDGGNTFAPLRLSAARTNTFTNPFVIRDKAASGQAQGDGGGTLDFNKTGNVVTVVTNTGSITLAGTLTVTGQGANQGAAVPAIFTGNATIVGADRELTINRARDGNSFIRFAGNFLNDGSARDLVLRPQNQGAVELSGTNTAVTDMHIVQAFQGGNGKVIFATTNALPSGTVYVNPFTVVGLGFSMGASAANIHGLTNKFSFGPDSTLSLNGGGLPAATETINLGPGGLNSDVIIGSRENLTITYTNPFTPFSTTYKFNSGGGNVTMAGTNQLTGVGNSLQVGPHPYMSPSGGPQGGTFTLNNAQSYGGGTLIYPSLPAVVANAVNGNTVNVVNSNTLGTGTVNVYGTLQFIGANGSALDGTGTANANTINLQPGGALTLGQNTVVPRDRWADTQGIALRGNQLQLVGRTNSGAATDTIETVGTITYSLGNLININNAVGAQAFANPMQTYLIAADLVRSGAGTVEFIRAANTTPITNDVSFGAGSRVVLTTAPTPVNGMISPNLISRTDNSFVTYDTSVVGSAARGIVPVTTYVAGTDPATGGTTDIFDLTGAGTNITALAGPVDVYALRTLTNAIRGVGTNVNVGSGGLITGGLGHTADFSFGGGSSEGLIFVTGGTAIFSNNLSANGITKFGPGAMTLANFNRSYSNGWNINWGTVNVSGSNALGTAAAGNFVNLNNGQNTVALVFNQNANNVVYNSGPITSYDRNTITFNLGGGTRIQSFAPMGLTLDKAAGGPVESYLRVNIDQTISTIRVLGATTLAADAIIDVNGTAHSTGSQATFDLTGGLVGSGRTLGKIGNGVLGLTTDNSSSWTGGTINVNGGGLSLANNGSAGNGASTVNIDGRAALILDPTIVNFTPLATINQAPGSVERWLGSFNRWNMNSSAETYSVPSTIALQIRNDVIATNKTIQLNGGSIEGYQPADSATAAMQIGSGVTLNLAADSRIGQHRGISQQDSIGRAGVTLTVNGQVTGTGSLTKMGLDAVTLARSNTYSGGTLVAQGTLNVNNGGVNITNGISTNGSATGSGNVTVAAQAMLGGANGRIEGNLNVQGNGGFGINGGMLMPNTQGGIGAIGIGGNLTLGSGAILDIDINGTNANQFDKVFVGGDVDVTGSMLNLRLNANFLFPLTNQLVFVNNLGTNPVTGNFTLSFGVQGNEISTGQSLTEGAFITIDPNTANNFNNSTAVFQISYLLGDGNDIGFTIVPEPSQVALMVLGGALVGWQLVRRRRNR